jgi:acyl carrier protein phosphodiesterase
MNFLAHCLIPDRARHDTHPDLIAGGFLGDFLKGPVPHGLPGELRTGVRLHRRIDAYSNQHPGIRASCARFPAELRRFAPIFVDVIADHLLARNWQRYHPEPLESFSADAYAAIDSRVDLLPERGVRFYRYMREHDLLTRYRDESAMYQGLRAITRRLDHRHLDDRVAAVVAERLSELDADFSAYFPDLIDHAAAWLDSVA